MADVVLDASALVDLLLGGPLGDAVFARLDGHVLHAPAHVDAEVLSALGRLSRAGRLDDSVVTGLLGVLRDAPLERYPLRGLVEAAWARRANLRLADGLYVVLAESLDMALVTTDTRLGGVDVADVVVAR